MHDPVWVRCRTDLARGCHSTAWSAAFNASMAQRGRPQRKQRSHFAAQRDDRDRVDVAFGLPGDALAVDVDVDVPGDIDLVQLARIAVTADHPPGRESPGRLPGEGVRDGPPLRGDGVRRAAGDPARQAVPGSSLGVRGVDPHRPCRHPGRARGARTAGGRADERPADHEPDRRGAGRGTSSCSSAGGLPVVASVRPVGVALVRWSSYGFSRRTEQVVSANALVRPIGFCRQVPEIGRDIGCDA